MERSLSLPVGSPNDELLWRAVLPDGVADAPEYWWGERAVNVWTEAEFDNVSTATVFAHVRDLSWAEPLREHVRRLSA